MKKRKFSINFLYKIIFISIIILTGLSFLVAIKTTSETVKNQAMENNSELLNMYMEKIDAAFAGADTFLASYINTGDDVIEQVNTTSELKRELAKVAIYQDLVNGILLNDSVDGFFFCNTKDDIYIQALSLKLSGIRINLKEDIFQYIQTGKHKAAQWNLVNFRDDYYMVRMENYRTAYVGAWISLDSMVSSMREIYQKNGGDAVFIDEYGQVLTDSIFDFQEYTTVDSEMIKANGQKFYYMFQESSRTSLSLQTFIADDVVLKEVYDTIGILLVFAVLIVFLIMIAMRTLNHILYRPLYELNHNMEKVKEGDLSIRMRQDIWQQEFSSVYQEFNSMMDEMNRLKIDVYEQQIKYQKMWLQYLQVQIQPHFFLNTLNLIYSMSRLEQNEMIQKLSLHLVEYFRYLFREPLTYVSLKTELRHVKNYLEIQKMRFPDKFDYTIEIDESEEAAIIPPLIIQTFVENCIKHAGFINKKGIISVSVKRHGDNLEITIFDNGKGFSVDMLKLLNDENNTISTDKMNRVGVDNARLRLKLFFNNNYYSMFYNSQGAVVKLVIPYMEEKQDVQHNFN